MGSVVVLAIVIFCLSVCLCVRFILFCLFACICLSICLSVSSACSLLTVHCAPTDDQQKHSCKVLLSAILFGCSCCLGCHRCVLFSVDGMAGPSAEGAAVWVPDSNATMCMVCQKTKFSAINRRVSCVAGLSSACVLSLPLLFTLFYPELEDRVLFAFNAT